MSLVLVPFWYLLQNILNLDITQHQKDTLLETGDVS